MFNPSKDVSSLQLCKRLKELGCPQDGGGWYWEELPDNLCLQDNPKQRYILSCLNPNQVILGEDGKVYGMSSLFPSPFDEGDYEKAKPLIKAPTVRELGEVLPYHHPSLGLIVLEKLNGIWIVIYELEGEKEETDTEADARAKMLI